MRKKMVSCKNKKMEWDIEEWKTYNRNDHNYYDINKDTPSLICMEFENIKFSVDSIIIMINNSN